MVVAGVVAPHHVPQGAGMDGLTAVCLDCGAVFFADSGHACTSASPAGISAPGDRTLIPAATLPDGTPHPDPFLAERGWLAVGGVFQRPDGGGDGEEAAA
jgi:hypothetical protein